MRILKRTQYLITKAILIEREFQYRRRRNQKYLVAFPILFVIAALELLKRDADPSYQPSLIASLFYVISISGLVMLWIPLIRIACDHTRTRRRLQKLDQLLDHDD